jgi:hypothetical protein
MVINMDISPSTTSSDHALEQKETSETLEPSKSTGEILLLKRRSLLSLTSCSVFRAISRKPSKEEKRRLKVKRMKVEVLQLLNKAQKYRDLPEEFFKEDRIIRNMSIVHTKVYRCTSKLIFQKQALLKSKHGYQRMHDFVRIQSTLNQSVSMDDPVENDFGPPGRNQKS